MAPGERLTAALSPGGAAQQLPALVPYVMAGFPRRDDTVALLLALEAAGAAAAEIGIPFSDPLADGPTIQGAGWQALGNGMTLPLALEQAAAARAAGVTMPLVFMTYINPVLTHGVATFLRDSAAAGVDGVIVPDLPADEAGDALDASGESGVALIPLVAPTTPPQRIERACRGASGFVYCVSVTGTTGARTEIATEAFDLLDRVRRQTNLPRALGFGLSRHEHLEALRGHCEAAVVASALLDAIGGSPGDAHGVAAGFVRRMLAAS